MAALDLTSSQLPLTKTQTSVGTTLQEIRPPRDCTRVSVRLADAGWLQQSPDAIWADGDAVATANAIPLDADVYYDLVLSIDEVVTNPPPKLFVAAASGTTTAYFRFEGR